MSSKHNSENKIMNGNTCYIGGVMKGRPPSKEATDFGKRVAAARRECGLTQRELGDRLGVSQKMIDYYERRAENVTANVVRRLSEILNVSADELLGIRPRSGKPGPKSKIERQVERIERLPPSQQKSIMQVLDMALKSNS